MTENEKIKAIGLINKVLNRECNLEHISMKELVEVIKLIGGK